MHLAGGFSGSGNGRLSVEGTAAFATQLRSLADNRSGFRQQAPIRRYRGTFTPAKRLNFVSFALRSAED